MALARMASTFVMSQIILLVYAIVKIIVNTLNMCNTERLNFIEKVADLFLKWCPQMSDNVRYWVACQFALESNYGNSRIAKTRNNFCGMKVPLARLSLNNQVSGFAGFESLEECVVDYCYWLAWNKFQCDQLFNLDLFTRRIIASKYCPDSDYVDKVYSIYNQFSIQNSKQ